MAFGESSLVAPRPTTKRCPSCHAEQPCRLQRCGCGQEFTDIVELRTELVHRIHLAWWYTALATAILAVCVGIAIATRGTWVVMAFVGLGLGLRSQMVRADAKASLRDIDKATGTLPSAKLVR
jgi:hypothetical protein